MKLLLDTNRLSDALALKSDVLDVLESAESLHVPVVVLGEMRAGFASGKRAKENEERLTWFLSQEGVSAIAIEGPTSHRYAELHRVLRARGTPIPTNDLWIAAIALEHGLVVYTRDDHFATVPGLALL